MSSENLDETIRSYELEIMLSVQKQLQTIPSSLQTRECSKILQEVNKYLHKYCNHDIVRDLIDISPSQSKEIEYCVICGNIM